MKAAVLHELPGTCAHFVVDRDGTIYRLVPVSLMCRHTVGLNYTAIGIEHVGTTDAQILGNRRQLDASLELTRWLRCRFGIPVRDVIGHNESLSSPYHRERIAECLRAALPRIFVVPQHDPRSACSPRRVDTRSRDARSLRRQANIRCCGSARLSACLG